MYRRAMRIALGLALAVLVGACGDDGGSSTDGPPGGDGAGVDGPRADAPPVTFTFSGTVVGPASPAAGPVWAAWLVTTGNDYEYKFGEGTSAGATFTGGLRGDPPTMARNIAAQTDVGVGILILSPPGTVVPDGVVAGVPDMVGVSARHALIYRGPDDTGAIVAWTTRFPIGLSCGRCVDVTGDFDTYEPVDCTALVIDTDPAPDVCNFT